MSTASEEQLRARVREALLDLCEERAFHEVTVAALCREAEIDQRTFDDRYGSLEECALQVQQETHESYLRQTEAACEGLTQWRDRVRATAYAQHRFLSADERVVKFTFLAVRTVGERSLLMLGAQIKDLLDLIDEGRAEPTAPPGLTRATAESIGGGIFNQIYLVVSKGEPLPPEAEIVPQLMYSVVLPYLGPEAALEELNMPPPPG